jgi:hypothetical protein
VRRLAPRRVVVTLTTGTTIDGTLALCWPWSVRVRSPQVIERGTHPAKADGVIVIPRRSIAFMQLI